MVKLAAPACLMVEVECIGFEILTLLAGLNGTAELCAQTLLVTLCGFIFKVPFSLGVAASTQIADLLGRGSAYEAREVAKFSLFLAGGIGSLIAILLLSFRNQLPYLFDRRRRRCHFDAQHCPVGGHVYADRRHCWSYFWDYKGHGEAIYWRIDTDGRILCNRTSLQHYRCF
jgi:hypothetical protein